MDAIANLLVLAVVIFVAVASFMAVLFTADLIAKAVAGALAWMRSR